MNTLKKSSILLLLLAYSNTFAQQKLIKSHDVNTFLKSSKKDVKEISISDQYVSGGIQHVYFNESIKGIPIVNSVASIHISRFGSRLEENNLLGGLHRYSTDLLPAFEEIEAIDKVIKKKKLDKNPYSIQFSSLAFDNKKGKKYKSNGISAQDILVEKKLFFDEQSKKLNLFWEVTIDERVTSDIRQYWVDAKSGSIFKEKSLKIQCNFGHHAETCNIHTKPESLSEDLNETINTDSTYFVYAWPIESPNFGMPMLVRKPDTIGRLASPNGWHKSGTTSYTTTRGNNVDCYEDTDNTNNPTNGDGSRAIGGSQLNFNFPIDHNLATSVSQKASIVNTFYWSNVIHDVLYQYGFDEASGNFQNINFGLQGAPNDVLNAEVQDGSGTCNANFGTPPDGLSPRMQMYNCGNRDGGFDNGVIAHEIGHGLSIRLTGGPSNVNCLDNTEQMGEGWSDFLGIIMTIKPSDTRYTTRPMGTWLFQQGPNGTGIRPYPYSTDMTINPMTYNTIKQSNISVPHGIGSVWATILWEMTWDLIDAYGFDPNIYHGTGGNNLALKLVVEAMKLQPCSPGFVDGRDAIFLADKLLYNNAHLCVLQQSFTKRGLGYGSSQGSSASRSDGIESFMPFPECNVFVQLIPSQDSVRAGDTVSYKVKITNNLLNTVDSIRAVNEILKDFTFVSATKSISSSIDSVVWKFTNVGALGTDSAFVFYKLGYEDIGFSFLETFNGPFSNFITSTNGLSSWTLMNSPRLNQGLEYFAPNVSSSSRTILEYSPPQTVEKSYTLSFDHAFNLENWWDYGLVLISDDGGQTWQSTSELFISNGYNLNSRGGLAFTGVSTGYMRSSIDLSKFIGKNIKIRFILDSDESVSNVGWYIDNVSFGKNEKYLRPKLKVYSQGLTWEVESNPIFVIPENHFKIDIHQFTCLNSNDAYIKVSRNGRSIDSIIWNTGQRDTLISNLQSGDYSGLIYSSGKSFKINARINKYDTLRSKSITTNQEGAVLGTATVSIFGGKSPYVVNWSNGQIGFKAINLIAGQYIATITDANGCTIVDTVQIIDSKNCSVTLKSYMIEIQSDQYPHEIAYEIINEKGIVLNAESNFMSNGGKDTIYVCVPQSVCYKFKIYDTYGDGLCKNYSNPQGFYKIYDKTNNVLIKQGCDYGFVDSFNFCPTQSLQITSRNITHESCSGTNDGSISITASGGVGQINYTWEGLTSTSNSILNLQPKVYILTLNDQINNTLKDTITIYSKRVGVIQSVLDGHSTSFRTLYNRVCAPDTMMISKYISSDTLNFDIGQILVNRSTVLLQENMSKSYFLKLTSNSTLFNVNSLGSLNLNKISLGRLSPASTQPLILNEGNLFIRNTNLYFSPLNHTISAISNQGQMSLNGTNTLKGNNALD